MMKKILYILLAAVVALTACRQIDPDAPLPIDKASQDMKVPIEFNIAIPTDGPSTKAMADQPQVKNIIVAVFGGSGYFNEWVPAEYEVENNVELLTEYATENETVYKLRAKLSMSESRLRLHIIANCPANLVENPPITGNSSEDTEESVMSRVRSQIGEQNNDGYWQKIYIPYGIAAEIDPNGNNGDNAYLKDESGNLIPTTLTVNQFKMVSPIPLVRNFARVRLVNKTSDVVISHIGFAYAPAEGVIAPILSTPYKVDEWGARVVEVEQGGDASHDGTFTVYPVEADRDYGASIPSDLPAEPQLSDYPSVAAYQLALQTWYSIVGPYLAPDGIGIHVLGHELKNTDGSDKLLAATTASVYTERFITNYQNLPLIQGTSAPQNTYRLLTEAPYNYGGTAGTPLVFAPNPTSEGVNFDTATDAELAEHGFVKFRTDGYTYLYERPKPRTFSGTTEKATRIIIRAKKGSEDYKFYALDILDKDGTPKALLRNFTYFVELEKIADNTGETSAEKATDATGANVSDDPRTQDLNEVSDGISSIQVSYIDRTLYKAGEYEVYYRFIPNITNGIQSNKDVTITVGYDGTTAGFVPKTYADGAPTFAGNMSADDWDPTVSIETESDDVTPKLYVQSGNNWVLATTDAQKNAAWSKVKYTTVGTAGAAFSYNSFGTIRVEGARTPTNKLHRDVRINIIQKKTMQVECAQKWVQNIAGQPEDLVIRIPADITRSMFPLEFKIEAVEGSITPRDGDNLPVGSGKSINPDKTNSAGNTQSAFYFIKTLTRQEYEDEELMPRIVDEDGNSWVEFTCKFKTTKAVSATKIYVYNEYFDLANDSFDNFKQRLFSYNPSDPSNPHNYNNPLYTFGDLGIGDNVEFTFHMDAATGGNAASGIWNNAEGITNNTRVIPHEVTITMSGLQPTVDNDGHMIDALVMKEDGVYVYTVSGTTTPSEVYKTLHLTVLSTSDTYSIKLSTPSIKPNPNLYADYEISGNIVKSQIINPRFTNTSGNTIRSIKKEAGQPLQFRFTYGGDPVPVRFKLQGITTTDSRISGPDGSGYYTFTPNGSARDIVINFTTTDDNTECHLDDFTAPSDAYNQPNPNDFSLRRANSYFSIDMQPDGSTYGWTDMASTINPDDDSYYGYQSDNWHVRNSIATMCVTVVGYTEFTIYIRSYAEYNNDYVIVRDLGYDALTSWTNYPYYYNVKGHTRGNQQSGTGVNYYTEITFTTEDGLTDDDTPHTFYIQYGKNDNNTNSNDDRGYVLISKEYNYNYIPVAVTSVTIDPASATVRQGGTLQLNATVLPARADNKTLTWTSSNANVTVDANGLVSVAAGTPIGTTATITATSADGPSASCQITVKNETTVVVTPTNATPATQGDVTISFARGTSYNNPNYYSTIGVYLNSGNTATVTVPAGRKITKIVVNENDTFSGNFTANTGNCTFDSSSDKATWLSTTDTNTVVLTSQGSGYYGIGCLSFEVTYE